jgi:hypothetical protein
MQSVSLTGVAGVSADFARGWLRKSKNRARKEGKKTHAKIMEITCIFLHTGSLCPAHLLTHCATQTEDPSAAGDVGLHPAAIASSGARTPAQVNGRNFLFCPRCTIPQFFSTLKPFAPGRLSVSRADSHIPRRRTVGLPPFIRAIYRGSRACVHMI